MPGIKYQILALLEALSSRPVWWILNCFWLGKYVSRKFVQYKYFITTLMKYEFWCLMNSELFLVRKICPSWIYPIEIFHNSWKINVMRITNCLIKIVYSHKWVLLFYLSPESYSVTKACWLFHRVGTLL